MIKYISHLVCICLAISFMSCRNSFDNINIKYNIENKPADFGVSYIKESLQNKGITVNINAPDSISCNTEIILDVIKGKYTVNNSFINIPDSLHEEGFVIRKISSNGNIKIYVIGGGEAGAMYGALELAELLKNIAPAKILDIKKEPYMHMRGIKFNIPLDARTPSYTDASDVAQKNIPEMWNYNFWKECIDNLALHRYNFISLWSLHPFPSMVKVPGYEDIALDDVKRSTVKWKEHYNLGGKDLDAPEILENLETLKEISIEEKIEFWQKVMQYAKERNIDFYVITWNIFTNGTYGKYGITDKYNNPVTVDYFRKSVKQMFICYPNLAGIGLTTGENMHKLPTHIKEKWAFDTYAQGVLDASKEFPGRKITLVHRQHQTGAKKVMEQFQKVIEHPDVTFLFSFKYAKAHIYSYTEQPYHPGFVKDIKDEKDIKTIWTLRNDDTYYFRWGAPDYVREFIQNIPYDVSEGIYLGSDQWIWAREFLSKNPKSPRELEISKHWYQWLMWGRLSYDPTIANQQFYNILQNKFPEVKGEKLFKAWQEASMIYPKTTGFHWGRLDFFWYIEGCKGRSHFAQNKTGFHDVNRFINLPPHPSSNYISIPDFVKNKLIKNNEIDSLTPLEIAYQIHNHSKKAKDIISEFKVFKDVDLNKTINDISIVANLGEYYANKIEGATYLEAYRQLKDKKYQTLAIEKLTKAADNWAEYTSLALENYNNPLWTNRVGYVDWQKFTKQVLFDIEIAKENIE